MRGIGLAILILSFISGNSVFAGITADPTGAREVGSWDGASKVLLHVLDPAPVGKKNAGKKNPLVEGYATLGVTTLKNAELSAARDALIKSVNAAGDDDYWCFNPRHAIQVFRGKMPVTTYLICYECASMQRITGKKRKSIRISAAGEGTLNRLLVANGISPPSSKP